MGSLETMHESRGTDQATAINMIRVFSLILLFFSHIPHPLLIFMLVHLINVDLTGPTCNAGEMRTFFPLSTFIVFGP